MHLTYAGIITLRDCRHLLQGTALHLTYAGIITLLIAVRRAIKSGCTLPMQGLLLCCRKTGSPCGAVAPYLCRYYYTPIRVSFLLSNVAPYLSGYHPPPPRRPAKTPKRKAKLHGSFAFVLCREVTSRRSGRGSHPPCVPADSHGGAGSAAGRRPGRRCRPERWEPDSSRLG